MNESNRLMKNVETRENFCFCEFIKRDNENESHLNEEKL